MRTSRPKGFLCLWTISKRAETGRKFDIYSNNKQGEDNSKSVSYSQPKRLSAETQPQHFYCIAAVSIRSDTNQSKNMI